MVQRLVGEIWSWVHDRSSRTRRSALWAPDRRATTTGLPILVTIGAFEALAVNTALPTIARDLDGEHSSRECQAAEAVALYGDAAEVVVARRGQRDGRRRSRRLEAIQDRRLSGGDIQPTPLMVERGCSLSQSPTRHYAPMRAFSGCAHARSPKHTGSDLPPLLLRTCAGAVFGAPVKSTRHRPARRS